MQGASEHAARRVGPAGSSAAAAAQWMHRWMLALLVVSYAAAAAFPAVGVWLRSASLPLGPLGAPGISQLLLAALLFVSAMGVDLKRLLLAFRRPRLLLSALAAKVLLSAAIVVALAALAAATGLSSAAGPIVLGLGLVVAMPAASSSPGWTYTAEGDVALALGVMTLSLAVCPAAAMLWLPVAAGLAGVESPLPELDGQLAVYFALWVFTPSAAGVALRSAFNQRRFDRLKPWLRLATSALLLTLIYAFAAAALADARAADNAGLLVGAFGVSAAVCVTLFAAGWQLARAMGADRGARVAFLYAIGMQNNGIALLLGAGFLPSGSSVFLPAIAYALCQHVVAAAADSWMSRTAPDGDNTLERRV